ncbi:MAG: Rpn family recombination-promoting nuclease/putative transposase [Sphingobacteriales bacterium]|nr:MAG: Rpn family recombination-promoting nuclease/putative transposase [Sphingobacteriales bacterium]TAF82301.1 MAG: Rpn family recombination-promoting nuclease/putative transposase [Sphingobacteriales bacterium]
MKFVDIKNDVAFRKIFGNENRKVVLISFLNAVLCLKNNNIISDVTILTPYQLPELRGGKVTIVDVKAKDSSGKTYIIEMQIAQVDGFHKRVLYYASKSYSSQINRGDDYENLMPTFFIGILDFVATQNNNFLNRHIIKDADTSEHFIKDIEFNFIELPKFTKKANELTSIIDQWVFFIKNAENLEVVPENIADKGLKVAYEEANKHNWTQQELEAYDKVFIREQDDKGRVTFALRKNNEEIARKLIKRGRPNQEIVEDTGLTIEQVEKLRTEK